MALNQGPRLEQRKRRWLDHLQRAHTQQHLEEAYIVCEWFTPHGQQKVELSEQGKDYSQQSMHTASAEGLSLRTSIAIVSVFHPSNLCVICNAI